MHNSSVRKQLKIRPGFTPQEDVGRFRSSRQQQTERNALPKGHIIGWVAPSSESKPKAGASSGGATADDDKPLSKSAAKNAKRRAKKQAEKEKVIAANWEDDSEEDVPKQSGKKDEAKGKEEGEVEGSTASDDADRDKEAAGGKEEKGDDATHETSELRLDELATEVEKLEVK